jgi:very-short-patch-repair endonuclease
MAAHASRRHGVVSVDQLRAAGLTKHDVLHRVRTGRLHRIHRGVYAVGHRALSREGLWIAAVLAVGRAPTQAGEILKRWGAAVSHRSAAELWGLLQLREGPVDVSILGDGGRRRRVGIRIHRSVSFLPADVTLRSGIPVTTPARTIADLRRAVTARRAGALLERELRRAIREAEVLGLPIGEVPGRDRSRSDLEGDFLEICRRHRLPRPDVNVRVGRDLVDFLWRDHRLIVETDGYIYHRGRVAFEDDRDRDLRLRGLGFDVIRISEKQIDEEARRVAETLATALRVGADANG